MIGSISINKRTCYWIYLLGSLQNFCSDELNILEFNLQRKITVCSKRFEKLGKSFHYKIFPPFFSLFSFAPSSLLPTILSWYLIFPCSHLHFPTLSHFFEKLSHVKKEQNAHGWKIEWGKNCCQKGKKIRGGKVSGGEVEMSLSHQFCKVRERKYY